MTQNELQFITELSGLLFAPSQIATMLGIGDEQERQRFIMDCLYTTESKIFMAYQKGKLEQEMILRKSVLTLAKQGSSPAQTLAMKMLQDLNIKETDDE